MTTLHDFSACRIDGSPESLSRYAGMVVLVVNTASECGFTPQYTGLQELAVYFAGEEFAVLGFPCNQFGGQEPGAEDSIAAFCQSRFGVTFPLYAKVAVNGDEAHPLWRWLTRADTDHPQPVKWNFTKFLVDGRGRLVKRYEPAVQPHELLDDIDRLLGG
ncbi:glutathione peroxidase [Pseudogulbenkiania sp. NH8B]|uniref:Glutathione peroxidase n=1 Tax=Pseudogulbenkiania ferrooxidans 2002 TaxID=279714 RepID=B9YZE9_9NEIS|nr:MULTISPECIES: glutathione peroxidase [Pseudogulbenkiania]EEG10502.1 Phospholipid-hydroperoxide glutathione peroxidase [Pseudogulbenkiania ferrooxidans 2002]BAK78236.1 glutathione peroxidase [Pseudogulbenkiania sp. NH8B]